MGSADAYRVGASIIDDAISALDVHPDRLLRLMAIQGRLEMRADEVERDELRDR